jgi:hypothetical protein
MHAVCVPTGYLNSYWNVPIFPEWCADASLDDKTTYNTMVRISGSYEGLGVAFLALMRTYGWRRVALLSDTTTTTACYYRETVINKQLTAANISLHQIRMKSEPGDYDINDYLLLVQARARGIALLFHSEI